MKQRLLWVILLISLVLLLMRNLFDDVVSPLETEVRIQTRQVAAKIFATQNDVMPPTHSRANEPTKPIEPAAVVCAAERHDPDAIQYVEELLQELSDELTPYHGQLSNLAALELYLPTELEEHMPRIKSLLTQSYSEYRNAFALSARRRFTVNMVFAPNYATSFDDLASRLGVDPRGSQGFYLGDSNTVLVENNSVHQALTTAVHEAIHVYNYRLVGVLPRWLNEGLAEYFEMLASIKLAGKGQVLSDKTQPLEFSVMLSSEAQWETQSRDQLYFSARVWSQFLMTHVQGRNALKAILHAEAQTPCTTLTAEHIQALMENHFPLYEQAFFNWWQALL
ncbi:hypothetical protein ACFOEE_17275 [Pseudoalteromonas fenneropenaei]|uniref:DUF1570 domain-containing protein n=1 Tax=Pseudoalteromonas fenneropenaei TaxID=1737459 RepID=A0ABV7CNM9_9GAMM